MKGKIKIAAVFLSVMLAFCFFSFGCGEDGGDGNKPVPPPAPVVKVLSVSLQYNDADITGGVLSVDISADTVQLGASVVKDEGADGTVTYASSVTEVATVDAAGLVTLKTVGETVVSASAGDKTHEIVLVVADDYANHDSYNVTVVGGTSNLSKATAGTYVTLTPAIPEHKRFVKWVFGAADVWVNGSIFKMPSSHVTITAEYEDMLYTLNVVGAKVTDADGTTPEGEDGGNTKDGELAEYDLTVYSLAYNTAVSLDAIDEPAGKIFVGWDFGSKNNRSGEMGIPELAFEMPDETTTVWAVFSPFNPRVINENTGAGGYTCKMINDGVIEGGAYDPELDDMSGMQISIGGGTAARDDYPENVTGSTFDTTSGGSQTVKAIFKNHHDTLAVTVELYVTYYSVLITSGYVTVQPGETLTHFFPAGLGVNDPWWGFAVRETVGGTSADKVLLDMVVGCAPTYPEGDKLLEVSGKAEYVSIGDYTLGGSWPNRPHLVDNKLGLSSIAVYGGNFGGVPNGYLSAPIQNMPAYDEAKPTQTVYVKVINNVNRTSEPTNTLEFAIGTKPNPTTGADGAKLDAKTVKITKVGEVIVLKLEIPRTSKGEQFYFSIIKPVIDVDDANFGHCFSVQMTYNDVMGYVEA